MALLPPSEPLGLTFGKKSARFVISVCVCYQAASAVGPACTLDRAFPHNVLAWPSLVGDEPHCPPLLLPSSCFCNEQIFFVKTKQIQSWYNAKVDDFLGIGPKAGALPPPEVAGARAPSRPPANEPVPR